jgi:hypothetical protein
MQPLSCNNNETNQETCMRQSTIIAAAAVAAFTVLSSLVPASAEYHGAAPNARSTDGMRWHAAAYSGRDGRFGTWRASTMPAGQKMHMCGGGIRCVITNDPRSYNGRKVVHVIGADPDGASVNDF